MEKYFNIAGPCIPAEHYMLPALERVPEIRRLINRRQYFVIHAPRQTGKTTAVKALIREINATEPAVANTAIRDLILDNAHSDPAFPAPPCAHEGGRPAYGGIGLAVRTALRTLCREVGKPMVVFFDEADCLAGDVLIAFLRQLRDGYVNREDYRFVIDLGLLRENELRELVPSNRMYAEIIGRYLTRDTQDDMVKSVPLTPWALPDGLDMPGLMTAFQAFWRENSGVIRNPHDYQEATPHLVLMAFLQRVTNGDGHILREMALGSRRLDLCVEYRGKRYAVEVKTAKNFAGEKSYAQLAAYLDSLGLTEGWMPVFDDDAGKPWDERLFTRDEAFGGKTIHVVGL